MATEVSDSELMARAIALAERGRRSAPPNPWVGCVLTVDGTIVGEGFHERPGEAHAEVAALRAAGDRARGATAYTTLEPCAHTHRTGPCADALIEAGVVRVVTAVEDPDPQVRGRGFDALREAGVDVVVGVGDAEATRSLAPYLHHRRTGRAFCLAKVAMTIDGRIAAADGTSQWITADGTRQNAHELRADAQAIVVGSGTVIADEPALSVRDVEPAPREAPLRVVLDARGRVPARGPLFDQAIAPTLVLTSDHAQPGAVDAWRSAGAKVEVVPTATSGTGLDLAAVLALLGAHEVLEAMFEGGARVHGALIAADLVDHLVTYVAPSLLGTDGLPAFDWAGPSTLAHAPRLELDRVERIGTDLRIDYRRPVEVG
ncbi:MAG: bifunctional diaminohydroxyphosphoribosylaminopyrimidine deaminase/5-amino-6-(5-phosphoribosylamino)uracil reductase RibD [Acidimicrobiia bacterium]|nr:bifunctional diaminohydroxyphosphoribosylaminopyrimidine deaminase/5-amino-6-(5-phosphoribosylamino)uracil reductase RibD [Acidimicrobiia bacterium]